MPILKADTAADTVNELPEGLAGPFDRTGTDDGYSLIEVIVSLALMATLVGVTSLSLRKPLEALPYKRAVDDLSDVVLQARNLSMVSAADADLRDVWQSLRDEDDRHDFDFNGGQVAPYGACRAVNGRIQLDGGAVHPFRIAPVTCQIELRSSS